MNSPRCEMDQRSARGYCPDESEGHAAELCAFGAEWADAPFCAGPSDQGAPETSCEVDGTCDDGFTDRCVEQGLSFDYETGGCTTTTEPPPTPVATLPAAGIDAAGVLVLAMALALVGAIVLMLWTR